MQLTAGWSVHTRTPGHVSPPIGTGGYAMSASPPVQISASARPAPKPPVASIPASMTRAPPGSCRTATRSAAAFFAIASAICHARSLRPSSPAPAPRHDEHTAPHPRARLVADVPAHDDLAARHAARRAGRGAARIVPRVAAHVDAAARHREPQITTYAAVDRQLASRHPGADG